MNCQSCATCVRAFEQDMGKNKTALRCGAEGKWYGRVTVMYPAGHRAALMGYPSPAWCSSYSALDG